MANPLVQQIYTELESLQKELEQFKSTVAYLNGAKAQVKLAVDTVNQAENHLNTRIEQLKSTYDAFIKLTNAVDGVIDKLDAVNFPERLDAIENTVKDTIATLNETKVSTLDELKKASQIILDADFDGRFVKLQNAVTASVNANNEVAKSIEKQKLPEKIDGFEKSVNRKLDASNTELQKNAKQLAAETAKSIHDLNIPIRMDKLDANIAGILAAIQNVQGRIESLDRSIGDKLKETTEKQASAITSFQEKASQSITTLQNEASLKAKKQQTNTYITWALIIASTALITVLIIL